MLNFGLMVSVSAGEPLVINPVTNLVGVATFPPAEVQLDWTSPVEGSSPVVSLVVYRDDVVIATIAGTATEFLDDDAAILPDTAYSYKIETVDTSGNTQMSSSINVPIPGSYITYNGDIVTHNGVPITKQTLEER